MGRISMATRDELVVAVAGRYALGNRMKRGRILDEFAAVTGHHRKHAMRLLRAGMTSSSSGSRQARRLYGEAIRQALVVIWEASDCICGKRLRPLVPILIGAMERHGHLDLAPEVRIGLLAMSAATIDRALREARGPTGGRRRRAPLSAAIWRGVAVRTFDGWDDPAPGFMEVQAQTHDRRQPGVGCGGAPLVVGPHRRADDARDAAGGGWLDTERTAPGLGVRSKLNEVAGHGDGVVAQPSTKGLRVGDARLTETKQGKYLGALPLRRAVGSVGQRRFGDARLRHAKGARQLRHCGAVHLGRRARETATGAEEQQHDGKVQPVGPALGLHQRPVRLRQVPSSIVNGCAHARKQGSVVSVSTAACVRSVRLR